jgi:lipoprotein-anchoring transpeptidase ErfK/SrfK
VPNSLARIFAILALPLLAACASSPSTKSPPVVPGYEGVQDGEFFIQPVSEQYLSDGNRREVVAYAGDEAPGTIVVDTHSRKLYLVEEGGMATRYPIAGGRDRAQGGMALLATDREHGPHPARPVRRLCGRASGGP